MQVKISYFGISAKIFQNVCSETQMRKLRRCCECKLLLTEFSELPISELFNVASESSVGAIVARATTLSKCQMLLSESNRI